MSDLEQMYADADDLKVIIVDDVIYLGNLIVALDDVTIKNSLVYDKNLSEWFKLWNVKNLDTITLVNQGYTVRDLDRDEQGHVEVYKGMYKIIKSYSLTYYENSLFDEMRKKK